MTSPPKAPSGAEDRIRERGVEFALWLASNEALKATPENTALKVLAEEVLRLRSAHLAPQAERPCRDCDGHYACPKCNGTGFVAVGAQAAEQGEPQASPHPHKQRRR